MPGRGSIDTFNRDAEQHGGYLYTRTERLSSRMATERTTDVILATGLFEGRSVLEMGCGDGFYTVRFCDAGRSRSMVSVDAAERAVLRARERAQGRAVRFAVCDAHHAPFPADSFDLVLLQSILHHDDRPADLIRESFRLAPAVLIHEPNGNNPGLKVIEQTSRYHIEHGEKSYGSRQTRRWIEQAGGKVMFQRFAGFVPMFCPDWMARLMKALEPAVETLPLVNAVGCAVYVIGAARNP